MITKHEYLKAKAIVRQYEKEQNDTKFLIEMAMIQFPINTYVVSKLNTAVRGSITGYRMWRGIVQLVVKNGQEKTTILIHNAQTV